MLFEKLIYFTSNLGKLLHEFCDDKGLDGVCCRDSWTLSTIFRICMETCIQKATIWTLCGFAFILSGSAKLLAVYIHWIYICNHSTFDASFFDDLFRCRVYCVPESGNYWTSMLFYFFTSLTKLSPISLSVDL